jgi:hypothetical protein
MSADSTLPRELLRDSEATLRIVDTLLDELRDSEPTRPLESDRVVELLDELTSRPTGLSALPRVLLHAFAEVSSALEALRLSRSVLEQATFERVQRTQEKLREVSSATEVAATDILNGLDHAVQLTDRLDALASDGAGEALGVRAELREELFRLMGCLQFQDITSQQLQYAASVLGDIESRLAAVAALFGGVTGTATATDHGGVTFDPFASMNGADHRQAVADSIFDPEPEAAA